MVQVETRDGIPIRIQWCGRFWLVQSVEASWCVQGRWWLRFARGHNRGYFRVILRGPHGECLCADVMREDMGAKGTSITKGTSTKSTSAQDGDWRVVRVWD